MMRPGYWAPRAGLSFLWIFSVNFGVVRSQKLVAAPAPPGLVTHIDEVTNVSGEPDPSSLAAMFVWVRFGEGEAP